MAHNLRENDSMISVGTRPWHGLGKTLEQPPSSGAVALSLAGLGWQVDKVPMYLGDGRQVRIAGAVSEANSGAYGAIVRQDTQEMLGVVGPGYTPYQNSDMASLFDPLIQDGVVDIETCGSLFNGRRVWMLAKFKKGSQAISDANDTVARYLMLAHGHDGMLAVRFGFTYIRVVCWNTLSLAVKNKSQSQLMKCLHTTNLKTNLELLRNAMNATEELFELTADQYRLLANRGVSRASLREYARIIVEADQDDKKWTRSQQDKIGKIVGAAIEGRGNKGKTWWDAYNGATEYLTWQASKTAQNRFNNLWFGSAYQTNTEALELALTMAS
jgi:phage/plasmid-like protein (TIGR03299 family)